MVSGIEISARMVSLAINIALMGFILASGVAAHLVETTALDLNGTDLRRLAERIAAGNAVSHPGLSSPVIHAALAQGFGWLMLYGGLAVWLLAGVSFVIFNVGAFRNLNQYGAGAPSPVADRQRTDGP